MISTASATAAEPSGSKLAFNAMNLGLTPGLGSRQNFILLTVGRADRIRGILLNAAFRIVIPNSAFYFIQFEFRLGHHRTTDYVPEHRINKYLLRSTLNQATGIIN